jgi:hypothetical protein
MVPCSKSAYRCAEVRDKRETIGNKIKRPSYSYIPILSLSLWRDLSERYGSATLREEKLLSCKFRG